MVIFRARDFGSLNVYACSNHFAPSSTLQFFFSPQIRKRPSQRSDLNKEMFMKLRGGGGGAARTAMYAPVHSHTVTAAVAHLAMITM